MASSQVEIPSPAPFGCVLKDHGHHRDGFVDSPSPNKASITSQDTFHNKLLLKSFVRDHLHPFHPNDVQDPQINDGPIDPWFLKGHKIDPFEREGECSTTLSPSQARIVDRWAAQQARGMVSTIEKHAQEADLLYQSDSRKPRASASLGQTSPSQSSDNSNKGASSLVQMWEARLSRPNANNNNNNANSLGCCSLSNSSALSCPENALNSPREESFAYVEGARQTNEDLFAEWESDGAGTAKDPSPSFKGMASSASDSERGRVANIIRRLTTTRDVRENDPSPAANSPYRERERTPRPDHAFGDQKAFLHATSSPRIRGRQAFSDLLMQMERDRHKELETLMDRKPVSKFSQKGRIQSHLKIKLLQRGFAANEQHTLSLFRGIAKGSTPNSPSTPILSPLSRGREKLKTAAELDLKEHNGLTDLVDSPHRIMSNDSAMASSSAAGQPFEDINQEVHRSLDPHSEVQAPLSIASTTIKCDEDSGAMALETTAEILSYDESNLTHQLSMDACSSSDFWCEDEQEASEEQTTESNYDWISKISRPRSYWEDRRQTWYQEMLEQSSGNEDILQLLQRKRVSNFLCSDFRERMDDLMVSHFRKQNDMLELLEDGQTDLDITISEISQALNHSAGHQQRDVGQEMVQEREGDPLHMEESRIQDIGEVTDGDSNEAVQEEQLDGETEDEMVDEDGEGIIIGEQYHEVRDRSSQSPSSSQSSFGSPRRSWGFDDHDQAARLSSAQSPRSRAYYMDPLQHTRSMDHLSVEMELINELRGQMKQLRREMSELRRSIKTCMELQATGQYSMKQEISSPARGGGMSMKKLVRKSGCCICYDEPIDSLLYRCGHMCTCLKCAIQLQLGSGKCPTCRAPIEDVVRAYPDSRE